ncbi:MAG: ABC transporter ATP-binding protein [Clostridiaceae bacterium]|nr:ABC transporter ATP-binding protein [Clostridiaceae bacterium]
MSRPIKKQKEPRKPLPPDLVNLLRRTRRELIPAALPMVMSAALNVFLMLLMKKSLDAALTGDLAQVKNAILPIVLGALLFIPVDLLSAWMRGRYMRFANESLKGRYIDRVFKKNISEFQGEHLALYLSNITNDMNSIEQRYFLSLFEILRQFIGALGGAIILFSVNWIVAVLALIPGAFVSFIALRSGRGLEKHEGERSDFLKQYTIYIREVLSAFRIIRNNNLEKKINEDFDEKSIGVQQKRFELDKAESVVYVRNSAIFSLLIAVLLVAAMFTARSGIITIGGIILVISGYGSIMNAFANVSERLPMIASERPVFLRMEQALENKGTENELEVQSFARLKGELVFDKVSFAYDENQVLNDASFAMQRGGKYMLTGPSGGGKSTVLRLIRKYFNPDEGAVMIDDQDLRSIRRESYYEHLANVEQHVFLFEDTLRNNLTLYKPYEDRAILEAASAAGLSGFLDTLPGGLDYVVLDNGKNLSGGERARIAIARGLIADADLLLLDEAFASLDEDVARSIEQTLLRLENVTVVSVSHVIFRDTASLYDAIFEVKRGRVTQSVLSSSASDL